VPQADAIAPSAQYGLAMSKSNAPTSAIPQREPSPYPNGELAQICGEVAAVFRRAWGRGPAKATAHWAGPNMLVVVLANGHTDAEKTMRAAGHIQELLGGRRLLQVIIEPDLKASVERILGRTVETTLSATRLDPDLSAEIFLLAPEDDRTADAARSAA
jgi:uncharacterized protein YbcI